MRQSVTNVRRGPYLLAEAGRAPLSLAPTNENSKRSKIMQNILEKAIALFVALTLSTASFNTLIV